MLSIPYDFIPLTRTVDRQVSKVYAKNDTVCIIFYDDTYTLICATHDEDGEYEEAIMDNRAAEMYDDIPVLEFLGVSRNQVVNMRRRERNKYLKDAKLRGEVE